MYNVIEARYTDPSQQTVIVLHRVGDNVIEEYIEKGSVQYKALEEAGFDHDKLVDLTAEWKRAQSLQLYQLAEAALGERFGDMIKEKEDRVEFLRSELDTLQAEYEKQVVKYKKRNEDLQKDYEQNQALYGMNIFEAMMNHNNTKDVVFAMKLELLDNPKIKEQSKQFKANIRKAPTVIDLVKIVVDIL